MPIFLPNWEGELGAHLQAYLESSWESLQAPIRMSSQPRLLWFQLSSDPESEPSALAQPALPNLCLPFKEHEPF